MSESAPWKALELGGQRKSPRCSVGFLGRVFEAPNPMQEQQNSSTPDLHQALLFAPSELLSCGLSDAHTYPLVGKRTELGVRSWRTSPARAWAWPLVEWNRTGNSYAALGFDCDSREAVERAAASCMGAGDLPTPNCYATRTASGHAQVFYLLDRPVHRGEQARAKPLTYLARISEYYRAALGADPGYMGVLSSNPVHADYQTSYPRADPYALIDLARVIPKHWRLPRPATTAVGRNSELFNALCRRGLRDTDRQLEALANAYNDAFTSPMDAGEVRGILRSVLRYRSRWREQGHQQAWLWKQAARGRKGGLIGGRKAGMASGVVRRTGTPLEHDRAPWESAGVSRATWYRARETERPIQVVPRWGRKRMAKV